MLETLKRLITWFKKKKKTKKKPTGYSDDFWSPESTTGSLRLRYFITWYILKVPLLIQRGLTEHILWSKQRLGPGEYSNE